MHKKPGLIFIFCVAPILLTAQLSASRKTIHAGSLGQEINKLIIPVINQTRQDLKLHSFDNSGSGLVSVPGLLTSHQIDYITVSPKYNEKGKFKQQVEFINGDSKFNLYITGKVLAGDNQHCYDFKNSRTKVKTSDNVSGRSVQSSILRIYPENKKNTLFSIDTKTTPYAHIVVLIDASGSMGEKNKLDDIKNYLRLMVRQLRPNDYISILMYNEYGEVFVKKVSCTDPDEIITGINKIDAGGFTNGKAGIETALNFVSDNRGMGLSNHILMFTDGAFNLGSEQSEIESYLKFRSKKLSFRLSLMGIKGDKKNTARMKSLSKCGNGFYFEMNEGNDREEFMNKLLMKQLAG